MPEPRIEPREPQPGGADAIDGGDDLDGPKIPDLTIDDNPAVDTADAPAMLKEGEDTSTKATEGDGDGGDDGEDSDKDSDSATEESSA